ncbi:hypothetical protein ZYGR_0AD06450 [Zygosaccharomyces rouxii]|uniref:ZYRO0G20900p n=2 Tax=Zygosaccharomyces rouxii TaxID=4956 RepID=C5E1H0_ZYGRC|nr:uncharacterized protein ZYRO0G20900g [Zygosaccharomyces rouxii]KAH9202944.1 hypothetical protein LQ764DRAFT_72871 [Zygosaccharomyces rouxii]GAV51462.1 hypothetical protein ZYGR_0AD06450 [Zygosaccharomyces rouxii]CAR29954.1 ZYRO0G20900p [Zygosaccharomyces rouxii]
MGICNDGDSNRLDPVNEEILKEVAGDPFSDRLGSIKDSMSSIWRDSSSLWSSAIDDPSNLLRQISGTKGDDTDRDYWEDVLSDTMGSLLGVMGLPGGFSNPRKMKGYLDGPFTSEEIIRQGITGFYNQRTPTDGQFSQCKELGGLSVWNARGWWRCLFPEKVVEERSEGELDLERVITREKVEADSKHRLGLFFPDFTGYLSWKAHMNRLIKEKREKAQKQQAVLEKESQASRLSTPEDLMFDTSPTLGGQDERNVISRYQNVMYKTTPEGREQINERKTYYDNGTVLLKTEKKLTPSDGSKPKVETSERLIPVNEDRD